MLRLSGLNNVAILTKRQNITSDLFWEHYKPDQKIRVIHEHYDCSYRIINATTGKSFHFTEYSLTRSGEAFLMNKMGVQGFFSSRGDGMSLGQQQAQLGLDQQQCELARQASQQSLGTLQGLLGQAIITGQSMYRVHSHSDSTYTTSGVRPKSMYVDDPDPIKDLNNEVNEWTKGVLDV